MRLKISVHTGRRQSIVFHPQTAAHFNIPNHKEVKLKFGQQSVKLITTVLEQQHPQEISISREALHRLGIPLFNQYELKVNGREIIIGPFLALLLWTDVGIAARRLQRFTAHYEELGGALVAFNPTGSVSKSKRIRGIIYNPVEGRWTETKIPYAAAVFRRCTLPWDHKLFSFYGDKMINQRGFDKWMLHKRIKSSPLAGRCFPETTLFRDKGDILELLHRHRSVYLKPIDGASGRGIMKVSRDGHGLNVEWRQGISGNNSAKMDVPQFHSFLKRSLGTRKYIVQQGIHLLTYDERLVDFRLILAKDEHGQWKDYGLIGKYGKKKSIVSNISSGGIAEMGELALKRILNFSDAQAGRKRESIAQIGIEVAKEIEKAFNVTYGDLAFDVGVDERGDVWIIEVNILGDPTIALDAGNRSLYEQLIRANLMYAKRMSGFPV